jgi:hypothetical protein
VQIRQVVHSRSEVAVGSVDVYEPVGQWLRVVVHVGALLLSLMSPLAWKVPEGQLFQYCAGKRLESVSTRLPENCVGEHRQLPLTATHVVVCTTVWHTRFLVEEAGAVSHSPVTHTASVSQIRLE